MFYSPGLVVKERKGAVLWLNTERVKMVFLEVWNIYRFSKYFLYVPSCLCMPYIFSLKAFLKK